jgi:hypothetical protein
MKTYAEVRWRDVFAMTVVIAAILVAASIIRDGTFPPPLTWVSVALGAGLAAGALALAKRRHLP